MTGLSLGLGLGLDTPGAGGGLEQQVRNLFADNAYEGVWFDAFDTTTVFQDTAGTTPAISDADPVRRILDKSGNANHATDSQGLDLAASVHNSRNGLTGGSAGDKLLTGSFLGTSFDTAFSFYSLWKRDNTNNGSKVAAGANSARFWAGFVAAPQFFTNQLSDNQINPTYPGEDVYLISFRYDGANKYTEIDSTTYHHATSEAATGNLGLTGAMTLGDYTTGGFPFDGTMFSWLCLNDSLTSSAHDIISLYYQQKFALNYSSQKQVFCDGNSLTFGTGASDPAVYSYPKQMEALLSGWSVVNNGVPSATTAQRNTAAPNAIDRFWGRNRGKNVAVLWEITNDLYLNEPATSTDAINRYVSWCQDRQAAGFKVIAVTVLPRTGGAPYANFETHRQEANTYIRNNWESFADGLADVAIDPRLDDSTDTQYFNVDAIHLNDDGYAAVANLVSAAVLTV